MWGLEGRVEAVAISLVLFFHVGSWLGTLLQLTDVITDSPCRCGAVVQLTTSSAPIQLPSFTFSNSWARKEFTIVTKGTSFLCRLLELSKSGNWMIGGCKRPKLSLAHPDGFVYYYPPPCHVPLTSPSACPHDLDPLLITEEIVLLLHEIKCL